MKKRLCGLLVPVSLVLILWVGSALAGVAPAYYYSGCYGSYKWTNIEDPASIYVGSPSAYAQAQANGWEIGAQVYAVIDQNTSFTGHLESRACFSQEFRVTQAGTATISFSNEGSLTVQNYGPGSLIVTDDYQLAFGFYGSDTYSDTHYQFDTALLSQPGTATYENEYSFNYDFSTDEIGTTFEVILCLEVFLSADKISYSGEGYADFLSDFYNTAKIDGFSGGITPSNVSSSVPIPAAVWLLGSGLLGLVAVRRKMK